MSDLVEFLRARLDEDERIARASTTGPWRYNPGKEWRDPEERMPGQEGVFAGPGGSLAVTVAITGLSDDPQSMRDAEHIARHDPARVLAEVQAKRAIVDMFRPSDQTSYEPGVIGYWSAMDRTLRRLAEVYADHPEYRQEWTP